MPKKPYPLSQVYRLLEPGTVVMISTARGAKTNVMTMSWNTMVDFNPPLIALIIGDQSLTFKILKATKECVINIPTARIAGKVVACGNTTGRRVDKFKAFGLTPLPASRVSAPLVGECFANLECKVVDMSLAKKYNLFIVKVVKAWADAAEKRPRLLHHHGEGVFSVAGRRFTVPFKASKA